MRNAILIVLACVVVLAVGMDPGEMTCEPERPVFSPDVADPDDVSSPDVADTDDISAPDVICWVEVAPAAVALIAGQHYIAGAIELYIDGDFLIAEYVTEDGWELEEIHLWIGTSLADMPQTGPGNPRIGHFPYKSGDLPDGTTSYAVEIALPDLDFYCHPEAAGSSAAYWVAAHAALRKVVDGEVVQTETGWGEGERIVEPGNWAMAFEVVLTCKCGDEEGDPDPDPEYGCETAFAMGGTCFLDLEDIRENRWGWTIGPLEEGAYSFDIYAGAAQCNIEDGVLVGVLEVYYADGVATVNYIMDEGYAMTEIHLYAGAEPLPRLRNGRLTVAPGQYTVVEDELEPGLEEGLQVTVEGLEGDIHVIAHAVVCWEVE